MSKIPFVKAKHATMKVMEGGGGASLELLSIYIDTPPDKTEYFVGDTFTLSGIKVFASYTDDYLKDVTELVSCNISEGHVFTIDEAGEEAVVLTYSQDGVSKQVSFDITVINEITVNYNLRLNTNTDAGSPSKAIEHRHLIPCANLKSFVINNGNVYWRKTSGDITFSVICRVDIVEGSSDEYINTQTVLQNIINHAPSNITYYSRSLGETVIDLDTILAGKDKSKYYILFQSKCTSTKVRYIDGYFGFNITMSFSGTSLDIIAKADNVMKSCYQQWQVDKAKVLKAMTTKAKATQNISSQNYLQINEYGYRIGSSSISTYDTVSYKSTGENTKEWEILSDEYDKEQPLIMYSQYSTTSIQTIGYIRYSLRF